MSVEAKRKAKIELVAGSAGMDRGLADAKRKLRTFEREQSRASKMAAATADKEHKRALRQRSAVLGAIGHGVGMAIGGDLVSQFKDAIAGTRDFERELTRMQIDAQLGGGEIDNFRERLNEVSKATGQSRLEILKGAHAYQILTGDARSAIQVSKLFAEVANASGASMDDIAATAASLHNNLGFNAGDFRQGFDILLSMGHKANIELRQFGSEMNRLSPLIKDFGGGTNMDKLAEMAASLEVAGPSFKGSRDEAAAAAEGVQQLLLTMRKVKTSENFADLGVKIWTVDPKTKRHVLRDWLDILADIKKHVPDRMVLQAALGGRGQAFMALQAMVDKYDELVQLKQEALGSDQVAKDNATYLASATGRLDVAYNKLKVTIAQIFTPDRIDAWTGAMTTLLNDAAKLADALDRTMSFWSPSKEEGTAQASWDYEHAANRAPKRGVWQRGLLGSDETQAGVEQQAIDAAKAMLAGGTAAEALAKARYGSLAAGQAGARDFLKSEGYLFDKQGHLRAGMGRDADPFAILTDAMSKLATAKDMRDAFAGALKDAGLSRNGNTRDPGPPVNVKIGAEPVQKAAANSIEHRRGRQH